MSLLVIRSRWGAASALVLLQAYSLFLFHLFVSSFRNIRQSPDSSAEAAMDFIAVLLLLPIFIVMESALFAEIRSGKNPRHAPFSRKEAIKAASLILFCALYAILLFKPEALAFSVPGLGWALLYQALHPAVCFSLACMIRDMTGEQVAYSRLDDEGRLAIARMPAVIGLFAIMCSLIPGAPAWTFLALGSTLLVWGLVLLLTDDFEKRTEFSGQESADRIQDSE
ncbi:MAG: hypothetical protein AB7T27_12095 [Kiritimatiellia bacterium]